MPKVIQTNDQPIIVATSDYPHAKWKFEKFNPVQSRIMDFYDKDVNGLIAAMTSAGKTTIAEMFLAQEIRERGGKGMFLAPLRALAREKITDWTDKKYHFNDLKISICTGDYRLTKERSKELSDANLIIMTSEMLNHRSRNYKSEQNNWLLDIGTIVIDESHLLTVPGRGDHLEVGLMKFTEINPKARLVLLSATMPNVEEIADWVSYSLTQKETFCLRSQYRPVPLGIHYEIHDDQGSYDAVETEKVEGAMRIVESYPDDKFLIFAHTKRTGEMMKVALKNAGIESEFHNADLEANERVKVEDRFKNDPHFKVIIATSTLAWGCYQKGTLVLMADDTIKRIEDINIGDHVYGMTDEGFKSFPVNMVGPKEVDKGLKFELSTGESIVVSGSHKFYGAIRRDVPNYYEAKEFEVGDFIAVPSEFPQANIVQSDDYGYLCGYVMGDGSKTKCGKFKDGQDKILLDIAFGASELNHIQEVKRLFTKVFPNFSFSKERIDVNGVYHLTTKNRNLVSNFEIYEPGRNKHKLSFLDLPRNDKPFLKGVIQGLFDTDGGFSSHGNGYTSLEFTTISHELASHVQQCLLFFGVRSTLGKKKVKDATINGRSQVPRRKFIYRVRIYGVQVKNFLINIGFRNDSKKLYGDYFLSHEIKGQEKNIVPVRSLLEKHAEANHVSFRVLCKSVNLDPWNVLKKSDIKAETLDRILENYPEKSALNLLKSKNIRFSKIKKIETVQEQTMYDIAVDEAQNYVGGGVVSHNCNFPARRVIILGVTRGLNDVESYDITQMIGRSGRLGIDPRGDAYILIPHSKEQMYRAKYSKPSRIESQLLEKVGENHKTLAFHLVAEIHHGNVSTTDDIHAWYRRSLAYFQNKELDDEVVDRTLKLLSNKRVIGQDDNDNWFCKPIGKISSLFYFSPFDVSELYFNFSRLFDEGRENDDYALSLALGNIDTHKNGIVSRVEKDEMSIYANKVRQNIQGFYNDASLKAGFCYYNLLSGTTSQACAATQRTIKSDFMRVSQVLQALDSYTKQFGQSGFFRNLEGRITNGVPSHLVDFCKLPNISKVRARKLHEHGIKTLDELLAKDVNEIKKILNMKMDNIEKIINEARKLTLF